MTIGMGRRRFIAALGGTMFAWSLTDPAAQPDKLPTIGILGDQAAGCGAWTAAFAERLSQHGA